MNKLDVKKVLTIAGSDCSGGAGIQADIKTITAHGMYAMSAITALTAQNTTGVSDISECSSSFVAEQLDMIFTDIFPDSVKIGMVSNSDIINVIAQKLKQYNAKTIVVDPVMISTSGSRLLSEKAMDTLILQLLPLGRVITPNIPEPEVLLRFEIKSQDDMIIAAKQIAKRIGVAVLVKGGHLISDATDLLYENGDVQWYNSKKIDTLNTHGTGCTLSSAIACNLADGKNLYESIKNAKDYLTGALAAGLDIGKGQGPLFHAYNII